MTAQTTASLTRLKPVWYVSICLSSEIQLMCSLVTSIFLYACESWTLIAQLQRRMQAMEMRCYRKILHISYIPQNTMHLLQRLCYQRGSPCQDPAGNQTTGRPPDVFCSSHLVKTILQGTVKGGKRQGRQKKRWEDNLREWTGLEFTKSHRAVEDREKWRKLFVKSSVVPNDLTVKG